jgi:hypothetical protein
MIEYMFELPIIECVFLVILSIKSCNTSWILDSCENPEVFLYFPRLSKSGTSYKIFMGDNEMKGEVLYKEKLHFNKLRLSWIVFKL